MKAQDKLSINHDLNNDWSYDFIGYMFRKYVGIISWNAPKRHCLYPSTLATGRCIRGANKQLYMRNTAHSLRSWP